MAISPWVQKRQAVWNKTGGICAYCGIHLLNTPEMIPRQFCMDHIDPRSNGGNDALSNLAPVCKRCNSTKGTKSLETFRDAMLHKHRPRFTPAHIEHLHKLGIVLPEAFPCYPAYVFWFEEHGIDLS